MGRIKVIAPHKENEFTKAILTNQSKSFNLEIADLKNVGVDELQGEKLLLIMELDDIGIDHEIFSFLGRLKAENKDLNATAAVIVKSNSNDFTKTATRQLIYILNSLGVLFVGKSVLEALPGYVNFLTWQKTMNISLEDIFRGLVFKHLQKLDTYQKSVCESTKVLVLHSSIRKTSNTLFLWDKVVENVKKRNKKVKIKEIKIENGSVHDCRGCEYTACMKFTDSQDCFYGDVYVDDVMPAIEEADIIILICPNYNDAIGANLLAVLNRTTGIYRQAHLESKKFFSVIVSGNSGGDSVAMQLINILNVNKGLILPAKFTLNEIANDPLSIKNVNDIDTRIKAFAENILSEMEN